MSARKDDVVEWVAGHVLPHEAELRVRLRRLGSLQQEVDDIVQDTYLQIAELQSIAHIRDGRAYLFAAARSVLLKRVRHERIVRIDQLIDGDVLAIVDETPSAERWVQARQELARVTELLRGLPSRCREVFELRRIEGVSQRTIAERLGISEHMVEYEAARGLRLLAKAFTGDTPDGEPARRRAPTFRLRRHREDQP